MKNRNIKYNKRINSSKPMNKPKVGNKPKKTNQFYEGEPKILLPKKPKSKRREKARKEAKKSEDINVISTPNITYSEVIERLENITDKEIKEMEHLKLKKSDSIQKKQNDTKQDNRFDLLGWVKKFIKQNVNYRLGNIQKRLSSKTIKKSEK